MGTYLSMKRSTHKKKRRAKKTTLSTKITQTDRPYPVLSAIKENLKIVYFFLRDINSLIFRYTIYVNIINLYNPQRVRNHQFK